jgi:hypothetical protein
MVLELYHGVYDMTPLANHNGLVDLSTCRLAYLQLGTKIDATEWQRR